MTRPSLLLLQSFKGLSLFSTESDSYKEKVMKMTYWELLHEVHLNKKKPTKWDTNSLKRILTFETTNEPKESTETRREKVFMSFKAEEPLKNHEKPAKKEQNPEFYFKKNSRLLAFENMFKGESLLEPKPFEKELGFLENYPGSQFETKLRKLSKKDLKVEFNKFTHHSRLFDLAEVLKNKEVQSEALGEFASLVSLEREYRRLPFSFDSRVFLKGDVEKALLEIKELLKSYNFQQSKSILGSLPFETYEQFLNGPFADSIDNLVLEEIESILSFLTDLDALYKFRPFSIEHKRKVGERVKSLLCEEPSSVSVGSLAHIVKKFKALSYCSYEEEREDIKELALKLIDLYHQAFLNGPKGTGNTPNFHSNSFKKTEKPFEEFKLFEVMDIFDVFYTFFNLKPEIARLGIIDIFQK